VGEKLYVVRICELRSVNLISRPLREMIPMMMNNMRIDSEGDVKN
jgi:hypothetical protein